MPSWIGSVGYCAFSMGWPLSTPKHGTIKKFLNSLMQCMCIILGRINWEWFPSLCLWHLLEICMDIIPNITMMTWDCRYLNSMIQLWNHTFWSNSQIESNVIPFAITEASTAVTLPGLVTTTGAPAGLNENATTSVTKLSSTTSSSEGNGL